MAYAENDPHFRRLVEVCDDSFLKQKTDRAVHQFIIRHLLGEYHPSVWQGSGIETSIPLLSMAARAMSRHLISKAPLVLAEPKGDESTREFAKNREISTNKRIKQSNLAQELRECANQSMVSFGTMFLGPSYVGTPEGMRLDLEIRAIDRADFFYDTRSSTLEKADIQGHEFDMPLPDIHDNPMFDPSCRRDVESNGQDQVLYDQQANVRRDNTRRTDLYDYARIRCVYEPRRRKLWYYPKYQPTIKLAEIDWLGPDHGPYRYLYYEKIPGNAVPMSPLMHLMKKHRAFNMLDVRSIHQQQVAKALLKYTNASKEEAERILNAVDLQSVLQENGTVGYVHIGGASPDTVSMAALQKADFNYATGGILEQFQKQADTLGQERLLRGASDDMLDDMAGWAYQFVKGVSEDIFWYDIRDPDPNPQILMKKVPDREEMYPVEWTLEHRQFAMEMDFEVDVVPFSYVERSPNSIVADMLGALQIALGMEGQMTAQGHSIDTGAVIEDLQKYKNLPGLRRWFVLNQDPERLASLLSSRSSHATPTNPAKPNGRYSRESTSDGSGEAMEMLRSMGKGQKAQEMAIA